MSVAGTITSATAAVLNLIGILILNIVYNKFAVVLTDWENHRKESDYQNHLTFKMFLFSFVNSYTSIVYIAFFKVLGVLPLLIHTHAHSVFCCAGQVRWSARQVHEPPWLPSGRLVCSTTHHSPMCPHMHLRMHSAPYGCMLELTIQMAIIMVGKQLIGNLQEV